METEWLYDYLVQFLRSPAWKTPIMNFIDQHCIIFDAEEENKFAYTEIHEKFKEMIDQVLEGLLKELGVTAEVFVQIVDQGRKTPEHKRIFDQILACDNFLSFKKLMVKRNKELEYEALKMLAQQSQVEEKQLKHAQIQNEEAELEYAIAMSLQQEEERVIAQQREQEALEQAMKLSQIEYTKTQGQVMEQGQVVGNAYGMSSQAFQIQYPQVPQQQPYQIPQQSQISQNYQTGYQPVQVQPQLYQQAQQPVQVQPQLYQQAQQPVQVQPQLYPNPQQQTQQQFQQNVSSQQQPQQFSSQPQQQQEQIKNVSMPILSQPQQIKQDSPQKQVQQQNFPQQVEQSSLVQTIQQQVQQQPQQLTKPPSPPRQEKHKSSKKEKHKKEEAHPASEEQKQDQLFSLSKQQTKLKPLKTQQLNPVQLPDTEQLKKKVEETFQQNAEQNKQIQENLKDKMGAESLKQRQERLRAQRDLLLKKMQEKREKELETYIQQKKSNQEENPIQEIQQRQLSEEEQKRLDAYQNIASVIKTNMNPGEELQSQLEKAKELREKKQQFLQ